MGLASIAGTLRANLMALANAYAEGTGVRLSAVSKRFYGHIDFFEKVATTGSVSIDKYDEVVTKMREQWPRDVEWPALRKVVIEPPRRRKKR